MNCECCGEPVRLMCQTRFCGGLCETDKCDHPQPTTELRKNPWPQYPMGFHGPIDYPPQNGARF